MYLCHRLHMLSEILLMYLCHRLHMLSDILLMYLCHRLHMLNEILLMYLCHRLHMLSEIAESGRILMHMNSDDQDSNVSDQPRQTAADLLRHWESRLDILQVYMSLQVAQWHMKGLVWCLQTFWENSYFLFACIVVAISPESVQKVKNFIKLFQLIDTVDQLYL